MIGSNLLFGMQTHIIPNDLCRRGGISATWGSINQLGVFPNQQIKHNVKDTPSMYASGPASIFKVRQEVILFQPTIRKLVNESVGTFLSLQDLMTSKPPEYKNELSKLSRQYRSIIRACLMDLQEELGHTAGEKREQYQNYITIFYSIECIWHLCEILFVEDNPGNTVLPLLLDWVRFHFPKYEKNAAYLLANGRIGLESQLIYWETVLGSLMQGRIEVVRALLHLHSASDSVPFKKIDRILKAMPVYNVYGGVSLTEFNLKWKHWIIDTQAEIESKSFVTDRNLDLITRLVIGEDLAWSQVQEQFEAWYELLAAWLFFTEPTVKSFELGQFARTCISRMGVKDRMKHLDRVLLAALEKDILQVVKEIQDMTENGWFVTHLTDLLYHLGHLQILDKLENADCISIRLRESFLLDYGSVLMGHNSLWQVGLSYLDHCPNDGLSTVELLIARLPLGSEARINKILRECQKRNLSQVAQSICKIQGMRSLQRGRMGNALTWALKSQDGAFTSFLADKFLQDYCHQGKLSNFDLLDNLGSCMLASDRLIFLGKYCEFHKVYQAKDYKEAAGLIVSLISSKITPRYFWVTLLTDALPLLECDELVFSSNDTYTLLHCLEERAHLSELQDKVELIRLAIARNLGRALIYEAQVALAD